jgi:phosphoribosylamine--glycine ligase / phosphoribosylglycinamide formyltransferase / phosphoribosylformylglycinamidine cyclo-ligase
MPGMYKPNVYDLAGFALGIVESSATLPRKDITAGDVVIGLPSSGVHSNGFSLIHKVMEAAGVKWTDNAPFSASNKTFAEEFLIPTRIYTSAVLPAIHSGYVKAAAHITGGGLPENIPRVLPADLTVEMEGKLINMQPIYGWLAATANLSYVEMYKTFNCGVGMILIVGEENKQKVLGVLAGHSAAEIGRVIHRKPNSPQCVLRKFAECIEKVQKTLYSPKKRVGVLISGSGSNLQALIDATRNTELGLGAEICYVISNKPDAFGLERAKKAGKLKTKTN